ncbi:hypothetical protein LSTR_LSTR000330 [Laodelphax striatellus]|uniref:Meckelin n=1 Tax=Laodelphax striatellus TaxID=195883 RepID=A0A482X7H2_LAOST|nr:hypothetical protein LSTR_LSTR000330 [Laodelphax striatellus]
MWVRMTIYLFQITILVMSILIVSTIEYKEIKPDVKENMCNKSEFFHVESLSCIHCETQKHLKPSENRLSCICDEFSRIVKNEYSDHPTCAPCSRGEVPTTDKMSCIPCTNLSEIQNLNAISASSRTICDKCSKSEITVERQIDGKLLQTQTCFKCAEGTKASDDSRTCKPCTNETCVCPITTHERLNGDLCSPRSFIPAWLDESGSHMITYNKAALTIESFYLKNNLKLFYFLCKMKNRQACQAMANVCVLLLYQDEQRSGPCHMMRDSKPASDKDAYPWLYYGEGEAPTVLARKKILSKYSLDNTSSRSRLHFKITQWSMNGTWLGAVNSTLSHFCLCNDNDMQTDAAFRFGVLYSHSCVITAKELLRRDTLFYEPHLFTDNQLYAVPVLIRNLKQGNKYPNKFSDKSQWQLVRRYFLVDRIGGIPFKEKDHRRKQNGYPQTIRYLKHSMLSVKVQEDPDGLIYPPLLELEYSVLTYEEIEANIPIEVTFSVKFYMENNIAHYIEVWVGVLSACAVIWAAMQTWTHSRRSGRTTIDVMTLAELCLITAGHLSNVFFTVVSGAAVYTFVFYKGQAVVQQLLPESRVMFLVKTYIIIAYCLKLVEVIRLIWYQICVDIFLVDWERPKPMHQDGNGAATVSIWRTYFVANEWNEIQTRRKTSVAFQLISTVFLMKVCEIEEWSRAGPDLSSPHNPYSPLLRFSITLIIYITVYISQWLFMMGVYERYIKNAIQEFVDVCSIANISVFVLALENFGYYIHGRSAHGFADTDMKTIMTQLQREEQDLVGHRGLLPASDQQTFQISIPSQLREYYRRVMASISTENQGGRKSSGLLAAGLKNKMSPGNIDLERSSQAYQSMNKFLAAFLEHNEHECFQDAKTKALKDLDYEVREKLFVESLLDMEFSDSHDRGVFYCDNGNSFDNVLFYGNEATLVSFDLITFCFVEVLSQNYLLAAIVTGASAAIISLVRKIGGKKNLAKKTLIDERFLI